MAKRAGGQKETAMKTLFLNPPSFQGFDGGAGARYQARREIRSFWYPTWLAQAAAMVAESKLIDAPADDSGIDEVIRIARDFDLVFIYTSTPSFESDSRTAVRIKRANPDAVIGFVGPHVSALPDESLRFATAADFVIRREFDLAASEIAAGCALGDTAGVSWRNGQAIIHNPDGESNADLDALPSVLDVYRRDLTIENYFIGYLLHPYLSIYTGRGCPGKCIFCLWPQTLTGHKYRVRSPGSVYEEIARASDIFPQVKEFFIDDDSFTANPARAKEIAGLIGKLGVVWSTSSRADVTFEVLKALKDGGLRLLMVGYESGSDVILQNVRKGITTETARRFTQDCKSLGIAIHGTFMLGLPGETKETIEQTIRFARELDPDTMQVSVAAPYPGTELHRLAHESGWLASDELVTEDGTQQCPLRYPDISGKEIIESVDRFYKRFYFRPKVLARIGREMLHDGDVRRRRLREGREFFSFLGRKQRSGAKNEGVIRRTIRDGGPVFCQFAITDACNAHCRFCNFSNGSERKSRTFVAADEACAAIDVLAANGMGYLAFVGGEPTLHLGLPRMISHARKHGVKTILCTNGYLLDRARIDEYVSTGLGSAIISVDAASAEKHERNRGLPGVIERIAEANAAFRAAGTATTASVTISRLIPDFAALPEFLSGLGFDQVTFSYPLRSLPSSFKGYSASGLLSYSDDELAALFSEIAGLKRRFHVVNPRASLEEMTRFVRGERQMFPCLAGFKYFYLDWKFDLYRCHAWPEPMCSVFDFDSSKLVRDGCTRCMIDCYRDGSTLHYLGIAVHDAACDLRRGNVAAAFSRFCSRAAASSARSIMEDIRWIRDL